MKIVAQGAEAILYRENDFLIKEIISPIDPSSL